MEAVLVTGLSQQHARLLRVVLVDQFGPLFLGQGADVGRRDAHVSSLEAAA